MSDYKIHVESADTNSTDLVEDGRLSKAGNNILREIERYGYVAKLEEVNTEPWELPSNVQK